jgi:hypothetical protein
MSLQDDIFAVQHALEGKPEADACDRVCTALVYFEIEEERKRQLLNDLSTGMRALKVLFEGRALL